MMPYRLEVGSLFLKTNLRSLHEARVLRLTCHQPTRVTNHEERSVFLTERNEVLTTQRETFQAELDALLATGCNDPAAGSNVTFLHSDHLGRSKFATNANGEVVWDEGITTPFGIQITAMAAQTQALMFPGQYQDLETTGAGVTLSHNWHRTYDPTLGRYLQSDPIGLAGGLNRYAYVGGNPYSFIDPTGLGYVPPGVEGHGNLITLQGSQPIWYIIDLDPSLLGPDDPRAQCRCDNAVRPEEDVDFFFHNGEWMKILSGDVFPTGSGFSSNPEKIYRLGGRVSIPAVFPAKRPPALYTLKNTPERLLTGSQTPWQYLKALKQGVPSCANLPLD